MPSQVPVQPSEWHRTLLLPQAWLSFMNRAYNACVQVRSLCTNIVIYLVGLYYMVVELYYTNVK